MEYDELELDTLGEEKTALFVIISDTDATFNFVVSIMYSRLFNLLCDKADDVYNGRLPVHVRMLLDEFANIGQIPQFEKLIATIRSREISASIILQSKSQLKAIYKDNADTIEGNCDTTLFLGGKEKTTLKELAEVLGKETIDLYNISDTRGTSQSYGLNYQKTGKELMSQDEIAVMDGGKCIMQLRGVRPFFSNKFDITKHKQYKPVDKDTFSMKIGNRTYTDKKEAGAALIDMCRSAKQPNMEVTIGEYQGFKMNVSFDSFFSKFRINLKGSLSHEVEIGADPLGNLQRLSNALEGMTGKMADVEQKLSNVEHQLETAKVEVTKPFAQEQELAEKLERLAELNALLNMDEKGDNVLDMGDDEPEDETGEHSTQAQEGEPDRAEDIQAVADEPLKPVASFLMSERIAEHDKERMLADGSKGRVSVKEKLAEMKQKISDQKMPEKPEVTKSKGKEESL